MLLLLLFSGAVDFGVGEDEIHGTKATRRIKTVMVITNCDIKEYELIEIDGNIRNKIELIDDGLFDIMVSRDKY
jgi:hypothetical protein